MRSTHVEMLNGRDRIPLVVRARFERTFFGLGAFAAVILLVGGGYLMAEALLDPLGASDMSVLTAGFALALSSFLLVYLVWPRGRLELAKRERRRHDDTMWSGPTLTVYGGTVHSRMEAKQGLVDRKSLPGPM
jgi:hypothetical protein